MKNTKQVIVLKKFPGLRTGKYASQAAHASMAFLTKGMEVDCKIDDGDGDSPWVFREYYFSSKIFQEKHIDCITHWLANSFRKIVCYVETEEELRELHQKALEKGLLSHLIEDNGATEFGGVKTTTALAIGPHWDDDFVGVTDHLKLF